MEKKEKNQEHTGIGRGTTRARSGRSVGGGPARTYCCRSVRGGRRGRGAAREEALLGHVAVGPRNEAPWRGRWGRRGGGTARAAAIGPR
jgi:hypothetical protein